MRIGQLARLAGCLVVTVRYYEKEGLLDPAPRTAGNYRLYGQHDLERLRFILHCRRHGISLADIRQLLTLRDTPGADCAFAHDLVNRHLAFVEEEIASLFRLRAVLLGMNIASGCERGKCVILERLDATSDCQYCTNLLNKKAPE